MRTVSDDTLIATADSMVEPLRARNDEIEALRRLPDDLVTSLAEAGFMRVCIPEVYGGLETDPTVMMRVVETLATADASTAWCTFIGASSGAILAYIDPAQAREMFDSPTRIFGGVFAPRGKAVASDDNYSVNGRWQWGSGTQSSDWIMGGCLVIRDGEPELLTTGIPRSRMFLAPRADVEFHDTWSVSGLCGTGSTDFSFNDLTIPEERSADLIGGKPVDGALYTFPVFGLLAIGISCVGLGLARAAIDELIALAGGKIPGMSVRPLAMRSRTQADVARAHALLSSARSYLYEAVSSAYAFAQANGEVEIAHRRDVRLAASHAMETSAHAVDMMYALGGGTSVYRTSPLQRIFRDVHVATQHMIVGDQSWETTGRVLLGVDTDTSML
jgi:alkylation response protein AidB-like acyl-CoA dehydrogenase